MKAKIFLIPITILVISFSGCERTKRVITPGVLSTDPISTVKIGVIQPSGFYTGFAQGAELARIQINNSGGLLGKQVEFIVMDNQGERVVPDATKVSVSQKH